MDISHSQRDPGQASRGNDRDDIPINLARADFRLFSSYLSRVLVPGNRTVSLSVLCCHVC